MLNPHPNSEACSLQQGYTVTSFEKVPDLWIPELPSRISHPSWGGPNHIWICSTPFLLQCSRLGLEVGSRSLKTDAFYQEPNFLVQCFGVNIVSFMCFRELSASMDDV